MLTGKFFKAVLTSTAVLALAAPAQANLIARYLDATTGVDAWFDDSTSLTWLRGVHTGTPVGSLTSTDANTWALGLVYGSVDDWRLPSTVAVGNSEMGSLWDAGNFTGTYFQNLGINYPGRSTLYWSNQIGTQNLFWYMLGTSGLEAASSNAVLASIPGYSIAVHDGDVGRSTEEVVPPGNSVPEPESLLLALTALGALALARRRRQS